MAQQGRQPRDLSRVILLLILLAVAPEKALRVGQVVTESGPFAEAVSPR